MKNYKSAWPEWLVTAVTQEKETEFTDWLGDLRLGDLRLDDVCGGATCVGDLRWGDVRLVDMRLGDLQLGDLPWGDVRWGDVRWGDVRWGDVRWGDVRLGDLIWQDYFDVLWRVPGEISGLIAALKKGRVNGTAYAGECACLCGTIANLKHCEYDEIPGLKPDERRPIEKFFLAIKTGDTPQTNPASALVVRLAEAFQELSAAGVRA